MHHWAKENQVDATWISMGFRSKIQDIVGTGQRWVSSQQHQEWFIVVLLPHIRLPLMQQKVTSQSEALEIAMRLEASLMSKSTLGMDQLQKQLVNITLELQSLKKGKEVHEEVWCTRCWTKGHSKEQCPFFTQLLASGACNPLPHIGGLWCKIYRQTGHRPQDCYML